MDMKYAYNGINFEMLVSRFQAKGQAYICKMGENNQRRLVPPPLAGAGRISDYAGEIVFTAPLLGSSNNFLPLWDTGAASGGGLTQFLIAPFQTWRENYPEQLPGIKVTGLFEIIAN